MQSAEQQAKKLGSAETFQVARQAFNSEQHDVALPRFCKVLQDNPDDGPAHFFVKWIREGPVEFVK